LALARQPPGLVPVFDCFLGEPRFGVLAGQKFRLRVRRFRESLLEDARDPAVQLQVASLSSY
jgi:hypothetical protein